MTLAVTVAVTSATVPIAQAGETQAYVVGFHELPDERDTYRGEPVRSAAPDLGFLVVDTDEPDRFTEEARQDERVRYLEPDQRAAELAYQPDDPRFDDQYGPQATKMGSAWDTTRGSTAIVYGVLDSGVEPAHEDVEQARLQDGYDHVNGDTEPEDDAACGFHGTHVAGIASATIDNGQGIAGASQHTVTMRKIFDGQNGDCVSARISEIAQALEDLADRGAHVSANSWTSDTSSPTVNEAIDYAHDKGVVHVAAAGNDGPCSDCVDPPWSDRPSKVLVVSCTDEKDGFCSYASQGPEVDLVAPGEGVLSLDGANASSYARKSGTSMSTPFVGGAVSLYLAEHGSASFSTIEDELVSTADDVGLSEAKQGGGRLDVDEFVTGSSNDRPTASFSSDCQQRTCTFDASNSSDPDGTIERYDWQLGDGTTATGRTATHTYDRDGDYDVTLTVRDDDGAQNTSTETVPIDANEAPHAGFTSSCEHLDCTFDASDSSDPDGTIESYDWDLGDGTTATGRTVTHTYDQGGGYDVTLTVRDDGGEQGTQTRGISVTANQAPTASFFVDCDGLACLLDASNSADPDGTIERYDWQLGDGTTATGVRTEHTYDEAGEFEVTLTLTDDDGAEASTTETLAVEELGTMHVHRIAHASQPPDVVATAWVFDEDGDPVQGVGVTIETCNMLGICRADVATTDATGAAEATWERGLAGEFRSCAVGLVHDGYEHAPDEDHAREGRCASDLVLPRAG